MNNKVIVPFKDKEGNTYELTIDLDRLSKNGILDAIRGMSRTIKQSTKETVSRLAGILDAIEKQTDKKTPLSVLLIKVMNKKAKDVKTEGMPSPRDKSINFGEGRGFYNTKSLNRQSSNPFIPALNKIEPSAIENAELIWFKNAVVKVKSVSELNKVVDQALDAGIRINAYSEGQTSFADAVILKMLSIPCKENEKEDIICELMLIGAMFSYDLLQDKRISEVHNKLYQEVKPQIDERLKELKEAGENAVQGGIVEDVCIDNKTFYMKFSKDSTVKPVEVLEGARRLGLNTGCVELGGNIIKIGDSEIEVSEKGGKRNYTDLSGDAVMLELPTSIGKLNIILNHDADRVQMIVKNKEMWDELQKRGEVVGKGCLFGGKTVEEAIKEGGFLRNGKLSKEQATEKIKAVDSSSETLSWVGKVSEDSKTTSIKR
nr:hypothetical protein [Rickettsia endosymbiont of Ceutorhynchus assimilis]